MIRRRLVLLLAVLAMVVAACGDDDDGGDAAGGDGGDGGALAGVELIEAGTLTVCTDAPYEPFEFEGDDGEFTGFDMELLRAIAGNLGLELAVTVQPFDGIWLAPAAGTCDIVASAMTITPERQEAALFSDPYFEADQSLLVRSEDAERFATLEDLAGRTIAVQTGTTGAEYAEQNAPDDAELRSFDDASPMFLALQSGEVDAILQDLPVNGYRATQDDAFEVTATFPTGEQYGFAVAQDNEALIEAVNAELAALMEDGTYDEIYIEWFGVAPD